MSSRTPLADAATAPPPAGAPSGEVRAPRVPAGLRKVLLRLPNWLGDVVLAAPAVAAIRAALPDAEIVAQSRPAFLPLARMLPGVDRGVAAHRGVLRAARALRRERFDAAVLFPRSLRAAVVARLARIPVRVGFDGRGHGLTHGVSGWEPWRRRHRTAWFGLLAAPFGREPEGPWRLEAPPAAREAADRLLLVLGRRSDRPLVAMEPGAAYGPAKCWPPERFGDLAARWIARGADVVVVGTAATRDVEERIAKRAGRGLLRAAGRTDDLAVLVGLLARANLLVANDTGPMHLAAALGTPVVALFGASDPAVSGPSGHGRRTVLYDPEPCSPCFLRECAVPGHPCLEKVPVERVLAAGEAAMRL